MSIYIKCLLFLINNVSPRTLVCSPPIPPIQCVINTIFFPCVSLSKTNIGYTQFNTSSFNGHFHYRHFYSYPLMQEYRLWIIILLSPVFFLCPPYSWRMLYNIHLPEYPKNYTHTNTHTHRASSRRILNEKIK